MPIVPISTSSTSSRSPTIRSLSSRTLGCVPFGSIASLGAQLRSNVRVAPAIEIAVLGDLSGALGASVDALHRVYTDLGVPDSSLSRIPGLQAEASVAQMFDHSMPE